MTALGFTLCLAAVLVALHTGASGDGGLRIFDGSVAFALAVAGGSLIAS
jgi:hypothetical protein